jgi:triacylglycerol lipase
VRQAASLPSTRATASITAGRTCTPTWLLRTAIWSRSDGLVNGMICHDAASRAIEVRSSHVGVQVRPAVMLAVARVLGGGAT